MLWFIPHFCFSLCSRFSVYNYCKFLKLLISETDSILLPQEAEQRQQHLDELRLEFAKRAAVSYKICCNYCILKYVHWMRWLLCICTVATAVCCTLKYIVLVVGLWRCVRKLACVSFRSTLSALSRIMCEWTGLPEGHLPLLSTCFHFSCSYLTTGLRVHVKT